MPDRCLDLSEAATYLGISERHLRRMAQERRVGYLRVGQYLRFTEADLDDFVARHHVPAQAEHAVTPQ